LFYAEGTSLIAVPVSTNPSFSPGEPTWLFDSASLSIEQASGSANYDVTPDGQKFIIAEPETGGPQPAIRVVQNWNEEFRGR
jgi:hypothetical protein